MKKEYYDHRSIKCPECYWHFTADIGIDNKKEESCKRYGYILHPERYPEDADDCPGYETQAEKEFREQIKLLRGKKKK